MRSRPDIDSDDAPIAPHRRASLGVQLGILPSGVPFDCDALDRRIGGFAQLWPMVILAILLSVAPLIGWIAHQRFGMLALGATTAFALVPFAVFYSPFGRRARPHQRIIVLSIVAAAVGVGCARLALAIAEEAYVRAAIAVHLCRGLCDHGRARATARNDAGVCDCADRHRRNRPQVRSRLGDPAADAFVHAPHRHRCCPVGLRTRPVVVASRTRSRPARRGCSMSLSRADRPGSGKLTVAAGSNICRRASRPRSGSPKMN